MQILSKVTLMLILILHLFINLNAQQGSIGKNYIEPVGGQPAPGSKPSVNNLEDQVLYQRAFEAVIWSQPAVAVYGFRRATINALGMKDNQVLAMSRPLRDYHEVLTANNSTPYIMANADLRNGPVVVEIPAASAKGVIYGQVVDAWQESIADVGPSGADKGKGGKYLFLPPGYKGDTAKGYFVVPSTGFRIQFAFRSIKLPGMSDDDANAYAKTLKVYQFSDAANPKPTQFIDAIDRRLPTLPYYDYRYFEDLYDIISVEPVQTRDKVMMGMLASLGIEPGKLFHPSDKMKSIMTRAAIDAYYYMQDRIEKAQIKNLYWRERHWSYYFLTDSSNSFAWETKTALLYDNRADMYHSGTYYPQRLSDKPAVTYMCAMADSKGRLLEAGKTYKLTVSKDIPVTQFWALIVYDFATWAFIYSPEDRVGLSSFDKSKMKLNADGSVDIYMGPNAPKGWESNWIPTQGKRPFPIMRFYGPGDGFWNKSFKLPDLELVD